MNICMMSCISCRFPLILLDNQGHVQEFNERAKILFGHLQQNKPIAFVIRNNSLIETINQVIDNGTRPDRNTADSGPAG